MNMRHIKKVFHFLKRQKSEQNLEKKIMEETDCKEKNKSENQNQPACN